MTNQPNTKCLLCNESCSINPIDESIDLYNCKICGLFKVNRLEFLSFINDKNFIKHKYIISGISFYKKYKGMDPLILSNNWINIIEKNSYPKTIKEKQKYLLQYLYQTAEGIPERIVQKPPFTSAFAKNSDELFSLLGDLKDKNLVNFDKHTTLNLCIHEDIRMTIFGIQEVENNRNNSYKGEHDMKNRNTITKLFISHSSDDEEIIKLILILLGQIGVIQDSNHIFCSSFEPYTVPLGKDFLDHIKEQINESVLCLFIFSENFFKSPSCLCEMGASWVKSQEHIPILIPPFDYSDIKGLFNNRITGLKINDKKGINSFRKKIIEIFEIENTNNDTWEFHRDDFLDRIENVLKKKINNF